MIRVRTWGPWLAVALTICAALAYAQSGAGKHLLRSAGLVSRPHRYVALSFARVDALPYSAPTGTPLSFPVVIENHRGRSVLYTLTASGTGTTSASGRGSVIIPYGSTRTVDLSVSFQCSVPAPPTTTDAVPTARVVITLQPSQQTITHTMYCRAAA